MYKPSTTHKPSVSFPLLLAGIALLCWTLLRIVLWLDVGPTRISPTDTVKALAYGIWFDTWTIAYLASPILLVAALLPERWRQNREIQLIKWGIVWLALYALIFGVVAEFVFWQEFTTRFNFIAVDYLIYTNEVIGNIRESYPVPLILTAIAFVSSIAVALAYRLVSISKPRLGLRQRLLLLTLSLTLPCGSYMFANVDQTEHSHNSYANELSGNGLFSIAAAMRRNELDYDKFYKTMPQANADRLLADLGVDRIPLSKAVYVKKVADVHEVTELGPFKRKPKNVVLVTVESLSAEYLGAYGSKENLTPNLDKLAAQGLQFDNMYATGTRTVRGLDALTLGTPPIPGQAIIHRPNNEHLATIGEFLEAQDYATYFVYGGYGYFDNMNAYFKGNDYNVIDRTDFNRQEIAAENVWGVADESLFKHTLKVLDEHRGKPFFAHIMTTSNHRPYTFPEGRIDMPQGNRKAAVKYTDYAIGQFMQAASKEPWFKDTLFVIVADHCASVAGKTKLPVAKYHIPAIFYAPDMLPAGHYSRLASQIDIAPTLLDLLGVSGDDHFFGESLFEAAADHRPARAFISNYQELGYYKDDQLVVLSPKQRIEQYRVNPETLESEPTSINQELVEEAIAYYQTAARAFKKGALKEYVAMNSFNLD